MMERLPQGDFLVELGKRWKDSFKEFVYHSMIWEELGFTYLGPVDGHDIRAMIEAMRQAKQRQRPGLSPCRDPKGPRLCPAGETDIERGHSVSAQAAPRPAGAPPPPPKISGCFRATR